MHVLWLVHLISMTDCFLLTNLHFLRNPIAPPTICPVLSFRPEIIRVFAELIEVPNVPHKKLSTPTSVSEHGQSTTKQVARKSGRL